MKAINRFLFVLCLSLFVTNSGFAQDNLQNIFNPVFSNPSFNAFNDCYSTELLYRNQWGSTVVGNPELYGANLFAPTSKNLGLGLQILDEESGASSRFSLLGKLSHYVKLSDYSFLGFGYGVGFEHVSYDIAKIYEYNPDIVVSDDELDNSINAKVSVGLFYTTKNFYTGIDFNTTLNSEYSKYKVVRGFDWTAAYFFHANENLILKPVLSAKYYRIRESIYINSNYSNDWIDPIFNLGVNAFLYNRIWVGVAQRFDYAQTYSLAFYINNSIKLGYTFERGIGTGINQCDSHMINLTWNYDKRKTKSRQRAKAKNEDSTDKFTPDVKELMYR
jgi:type IX secretion system PorP/SprF family membrane protein